MTPPLLALPSSKPVPPVDFSFVVHGRDDLALAVRAFRLDEAISRPYALDLEVIGPDPGEGLEALLGASCALTLDRGGAPRVIPGVIRALEGMSAGAGVVGLAITVVPALALLDERRDRRIWSEATTAEIVDAVVDGLLAAHGRSHRWALDRALQPRAHCLQHGESDLELVHRLLAEEGIHYTFEVDEAGRERVVFAEGGPPGPALVLPFVAKGAGVAACEAIHELTWRRQLTTTASTLRTWSWLQASEPAGDELFYDPQSGDDPEDPGALAVVETAAPEPASGGSEGARGLVRHQARRLAGGRGRAISDAIGLAPGGLFTLLGHPQQERDRGYRVTRALHRGDAPEVQPHAVAEGGPRYRCELTVVEDDLVFRPDRPRPRRAPGLESAIVVGPEGEEIHTDEHGRIQVRFHWDRRAPPEEPASAWLRVVQAWAGAGFGALFLPRIGSEVVVDFLGGDADRPVVVGCLYNGLQRPPFTLPDDKATSGLRTDSTPGGAGHSELSFDDTRGRERLHLRAQRDLVERVGCDRQATIGRDLRVDVGELHELHVGGQQVVHVEQGATLWVGQDYEATIGATHATTVRGDMRARVDGSQVTQIVRGDQCTTVNAGAVITQANRGVTLEAVAGELRASAAGDVRVTSTRADVRITSAKADVELEATSGSLRARAHQDLRLAAGRDVEIAGVNAVSLTTDGIAGVGGERGVILKSPTRIVLECGGTRLILSPTGIQLDAPTITANAAGTHALTGAPIRLN